MTHPPDPMPDSPLRPGSRWLADAVPAGGPESLRAGFDFLRDPVRAIERCARRFGSAVAFRTPGLTPGPRKTFLVLGPAYNRDVLTATELLRPSGLWNVRGPPGSAQAAVRFNYASSHGDEHTKLAKVVTPHLSRQRVVEHFGAMRATVSRTVAAWPVGRPADLYALARDLGQRTAFALLFGDPDPERTARFATLLSEFHEANWRPLAHVPLRVPGSPHARTLAKAEELCRFVGAWVAERNGCPAHEDLRAAFAALRRPDGRPLSPERLAAHLNFLGFAAYETMSSTMTWTILLLAAHPSVFADLADELADAPGADVIGAEALDQLPLLDQVVKEALRVVTPTTLLPFRPVEPSAFGRGIAGVIVSPHLTHRLPDVYREPRRFRPGRWVEIRPTAFEYLPFGAGPRRCPGFAFGTEFLKLALAAFVPRFRLEAPDGIRVGYACHGITTPRIRGSVALRPQDGSFLALRMTGGIRNLVRPEP